MNNSVCTQDATLLGRSVHQACCYTYRHLQCLQQQSVPKNRAHARCPPRAFLIVLMSDTFCWSEMHSDILRLRCKGLCHALSTSAKQFRPGVKAYAKPLKALNCTSCSFSFIQVYGRSAIKLTWNNVRIGCFKALRGARRK